MLAHLKEKSGVDNICLLTLKEIYKIRLDANVLKDMHGIKISLHIEISICHLDWELTWCRVRSKGVSSKHCSTLLMAIHD